jgi:MOSC domain-containing protein YiiM
MRSQSVGNVLALFIASEENSKITVKSEIVVDEKGIIGDKHHGKDINRSILITSNDSYQMVKDHSIEIEDGALGENLLINYNPYHLPVGTKFKIGTAVLEITQPCTLCKHLSCIDKKVPLLLKNDRGIFVKVVQPGTIGLEDQIFLLD